MFHGPRRSDSLLILCSFHAVYNYILSITYDQQRQWIALLIPQSSHHQATYIVTFRTSKLVPAQLCHITNGQPSSISLIIGFISANHQSVGHVRRISITDILTAGTWCERRINGLAIGLNPHLSAAATAGLDFRFTRSNITVICYVMHVNYDDVRTFSQLIKACSYSAVRRFGDIQRNKNVHNIKTAIKGNTIFSPLAKNL